MSDYWREPIQKATPVCPVCGEECEEIFFDKNNEVCGCENCVTSRDAYEWAEEEEANDEALAGDYAFEAAREMRWDL